MLNNLDDPTKLGPMMALELVSSFYGAFIAYVVFSPLPKRLKFMGEEETRRELLSEGLAAIQQGKNPKLIREQLATDMNVDLNEKGGKKQKDMFSAVGYSEFHQIADNDNEEGRIQNRHVDFFIEAASN